MQTRQYFYASKARGSDPGDLGPFIDSFSDELLEQGYSARSIEKHVHSIAHFGEWVKINGIAVEDIDVDVTPTFHQTQQQG